MQPNLQRIKRVPVETAVGAAINYFALGLFAAKPHLLAMVVALLVLGTAAMFFGAFRGRQAR